MKPPEMRHITCHEYDVTHYWIVRFYRTVNQKKVCFYKSFNYAHHGGKWKALKVARRWRDWKEERLPPAQRRLTNRDTYPGYGYITTLPIQYKSGTYLYQIAYIYLEDMRMVNSKYSITKWGKKVANERCEQWLKAQRRALDIRGNARLRSTARHIATRVMTSVRASRSTTNASTSRRRRSGQRSTGTTPKRSGSSRRHAI
jgi:hypothetical protein